MELLLKALDVAVLAPFRDMVSLPDFFLQVIWEGFVSGILYALIAYFAQGIMVVFAALVLVSLFEWGVPAWFALILTIVIMGLLALSIERISMKPYCLWRPSV